ncbi:PREDICTED: MCM domain-containing protein 2-like [Papilio polytes]|uniref:MCM domain-containing protein 2-like n=1 Tax=Papilio polytes TaxID=76194 RepID=UPI0006763F36|nr:PREDICTED: MCM domain-containing protein 2-like [Papilio polytes]
MSSNVELQYKLLLYLDKRRVLTEMANSCESFLDQCVDKTTNKFPPLRHLLEIDVMDLYNDFPELGDFLIQKPLQFQHICNKILFACINSIDSENNNIQLMQVATILRLKCIPQVLSNEKKPYYEGIMLRKGLLLDISKPNSYVFHTVWSCPEGCEGNEVILQFIPKTPPKCYVCRSVLFENSGLRRCGEKVNATFLSNELLPRKYNIVDDLISKLNIGNTYNIHVVVLKSIKIVWSVEESVTLPAPMTYPIPEDIVQLFETCEGVPWKFIYCLACLIGVRVCPLHCYMHVKINLLLSLVSVKANLLIGSSIINILVTGHETKYVSEIITAAIKFANRSVYLGTNSDVQLSMIGGSGGICILPLSLYRSNQKQLAFILKTLETGVISMDNSEIKSKCAVWGLSNDSKTPFNNLSSVFDIVCRNYGQDFDDVAEFMLKGALEREKITENEVKALNDLMVYINLIAGINVSLDKSAESLLKSYFLSARRESTKVATIGSIGALVTVSLTSARLCRRSVATIDDALFAIWLHVCGSPHPRFAPEEYLQTPPSIHELEENMTKFKDWLEQFTGINFT